MRKISAVALLGLCLGPASAALASDQPGTTYDQWKEEFSGGANSATDAGQLFGGGGANNTRGEGGLNKITGSLNFTRDCDVYCIMITNPVGFSATVVGGGFGGSGDTNLTLFTLAGNSIAFNDNDPLGGLGIIGSRLTSTFVAAQPVGLYYLAISRNDTSGAGKYNYPVDVGGIMYPNTPAAARTVEYGPDPDPILGWNYNLTGFDLFNYSYTINMTGVDYHMLPTPGAGLTLALGGLVAARRRRR